MSSRSRRAVSKPPLGAADKPTREAWLAALAERDEALRQRTATSDILRLIAASPNDVGPVLDKLVETACRLCEAYEAIVLLREGDDLRIAAHHGPIPLPPNIRGLWPISRDWPPGRAVFDRKPIHVHDLAAAANEYPVAVAFSAAAGLAASQDAALPAMAWRTALAMPLLREGEALGVIVLGRAEVWPFSDAQIALLQTFADQAVIAIQNARLFNETQEAQQQQTATAEVLKVISRSAFDLQTVLDMLVRSAAELVDAAHGSIHIREGEVYPYKSGFGFNPGIRSLIRHNPISPGRETLAGRVAMSGRVESIPDVLADAEFSPSLKAAIQVRSILGVPLLRDDQVEGMMILGRTEPGPFTPGQIELVRTFADQAVIAIENVRLFDEVQAKTRHLQEALQQQTATADVLKVISRSAFDLDFVFNTLMELAVRLSGARGGAICVRDGDAFRICANVDPDPEVTRSIVGRQVAPSRDSTFGRVLLSRQIEEVPDVAADPEYDWPRWGARARLGVPMLRDGELVGVFTLVREAPGRFAPRIVELVQTFADQAIIAIENTRLFDEVQARTRDLQEALQQQTATSDVLKVISRSAFDLDKVLETLVQSAQRLCGAQGGMIFVRDGDVYRLAAHVGMAEAFVRFRLENPLHADRRSAVGRVALTGEAAHVADAFADPDIQKVGPQLGGFRAVLSIPLMREGEVVGIFALSRPEPCLFALGQIKLVQTFADQAAIAIANVRLFNEVKSKTDDLSEALQLQTATSEVLKVISRSAFDLQAVFDTLTASAVELCGAFSGSICVRDGDVYRYRGNAGPGLSEAMSQYLASHPATPGRGSIVGRVLLLGRVEEIPDVVEDADYLVPLGAHGQVSRALLGVPLLGKDGIEGALVLTRKEPGHFTRRQIEIVETFADQAVIAVENVRLFDEVQARTKELALSLDNLHKAQDRLVQSEKLASLGQLTAGIAHEIKNPLNFVNNFSALSRELIDELASVIEVGAARKRAARRGGRADRDHRGQPRQGGSARQAGGFHRQEHAPACAGGLGRSVVGQRQRDGRRGAESRLSRRAGRKARLQRHDREIAGPGRRRRRSLPAGDYARALEFDFQRVLRDEQAQAGRRGQRL